MTNEVTQKTTSDEKNVSSSNGLEGKVPELRFSSYNNPWVAEKLSDFTVRITRKNSKNQTDLPLTISSKDGLVDQVTFFNKKVSSKDMSGYYLLQKGEFAYNKSYSNGFDFGSIKRLERYDMGALSTLYICFALKKYCSDFIRHYFDSLKWYRQIYIISAEGARNHGLLNVPTDDFFSTLHYISPDINEQEKIAAFLSLVDARIEKQRQLVEALKKYKRGLLSAIFERKLEFSSSTWHSVALSECCNGFDNLRKPISSELREKGTIPYYGANGIQDYVKNYIFDGEYILLAEDGGHFDDFTNSSIAQYITGKSWVNNHAHILQAKPGYNNKYIYYTLVHKDIRKYINGTSRAKLNQEDMWQIKIITPDISTQNKIARFMTAIDEKISQEEYNLFQFYKIKRGLLQQMFI
ncbi:MAG: restriction endonuclease subunit S [Alphaproteobacteria bacterium]|nr:restriction endonuclease subunit S [Alphaproteobacteria bacterium]